MAAGMDGYLSKPIRIAEIQAVLEHWGDVIANQSEKVATDRMAVRGVEIAALLEPLPS
jgi:CheY-like chemotaxis protein